MIQLFKKDSKGNIRVWQTYTEAEVLIEKYGLVNGKLTENAKRCTPKNIGKTNATTAGEQALAELGSNILSKKDEGYFETIEEAMNANTILPMLAHSYKDHEDKIDWATTFVQPKLDGMRCLAILNPGDEPVLISRKGKKITTLPHITAALVELTKGLTEHVILDGELYNHDISFQENMSLIKKYQERKSEGVLYHVYDMVSPEKFNERYLKAYSLVAGKFAPLQMVPTEPINSKLLLQELHTLNLMVGFEGTMIRWGRTGYEMDSRSKFLLKYKDFKDCSCKVIDIVPADARPEQGILVCEYKNGVFRATMKGTNAFREEVLTNKDQYIGQLAEIRYFEETDGGLPRFPVAVGFRAD